MKQQTEASRMEVPLSFEHEFLLLNQRYTRRNPFPVLIIFGAIAMMAYGHVTTSIVIAWYLLTSALLLGRVFLINKMIPLDSISDKKKINIIVLMNALNGFMLFCSLYFFFHVPPLERAFQVLILTGLAVGVTAQNVGYKKAVLPYLFLTIFPITFAIMFYPAPADEKWIYYIVGFINLFFIANTIMMGNDSFKLFKGSIDLRSRVYDTNQRLEQALAESQSSNAAKTRFLAAASHDLRQPVHTLSLFSAALRSRNLDPKTAEITQAMDRSILALNNQLEALLDISKLDAGVIKPDLKHLDVVTIMQQQMEFFEPLARQKAIKLSLQADGSGMVQSDPILLGQIFNNLLGNAVKYTQQGEVNIILSHVNNELLISISDSGIGIETSELDRIFEEFYQVNNPHRDRTEGLGLGLSIVRRLTKLLDIDMQLTSVLGEGTCIQLRLPLSQRKADSKTKSARPAQTLFDISVLVVDDEADVLLATQAYLEAIGCHVLLARDEPEAIRIAQQQPLDLLITDLRLRNNSSGIDVIRAIRDIHANLPAIIITGDTAPDRLKEASSVDAGFMNKPIDGEKLKKLMSKTLRQAPAPSPA